MSEFRSDIHRVVDFKKIEAVQSDFDESGWISIKILSSPNGPDHETVESDIVLFSEDIKKTTKLFKQSIKEMKLEKWGT